MNRRLIALVVVAAAVLIAIAVASFPRLSPRIAPADGGAGAPADAPAAAQTPSAPDWSRLGLHIEAYSAGAADDLVIVVQLFDRTARQADAIRAAAGRQWKGSMGADATPLPPAPPAWADRIQLVKTPSTFVTVFDRPDTADGRARLVVRPIVSGAVVRAILELDGTTIESNELTIDPVPAPGLDTLIARGRIQEVLERWDALAPIADELMRSFDRSPWGYYFKGVVERGRQNPEAAREAFARAMERVEPGQEPPVGLVAATK